MTTADECQQYAKECVHWAAQAKTENERKAFLDMARAWRQAALRFGDGTARPCGRYDDDSAAVEPPRWWRVW